MVSSPSTPCIGRRLDVILNGRHEIILPCHGGKLKEIIVVLPTKKPFYSSNAGNICQKSGVLGWEAFHAAFGVMQSLQQCPCSTFLLIRRLPLPSPSHNTGQIPAASICRDGLNSHQGFIDLSHAKVGLVSKERIHEERIHD